MVLGRKLYEEDIGFLYHFGTLTMNERDKAVADFRDNPDAKVLISSFRCGGVSLNLTCANRVILVDLWWNTALEEQAFGRVKRIGQEKRTHFVRIMARSTIDIRLRDLQERKKRECDAIYEAGGRARHKRLSLEEIASLFGELVMSGGQRHVVCDYDKNPGFGGDAVVVTAADNSKVGQANEDLVDSEGSNNEEMQDGDDNLSDF
ncbi:DNA repair protein rad8 [Madurella mycetomatis]|uniref:DNA repair protein rad8 n=1 Tax=Madurella mycetomatis TaxID=100816 RepID=A0A175W1A7_9PEZI|nr:DNA repair protein rad8 [Madurella mycetomatis]KXX78417.1 DNA repair protein rad8 [Madurella mycetomatis]